MNEEWSVLIEVAGDDGEIDVDAIDDVVDILVAHAPAATVGRDRYSVRLAIEGDDAGRALQTAIDCFYGALQKADLPIWPVVRVEAQRAEDVEADLAQPNFPPLVGVAELAELLGVSKQRASELARSPGFATPLALLKSGPIWLEDAVLRHLNDWRRVPGRPRDSQKGASVTKKALHVVPHGEGWAVRRESATRVSSVHRTQAEAERAGRETAKREKTEFLVHGRDGAIRKRDSYGRDPYPPKG